MDRRGVSLVELMIMMLIALVLCGVIWYLFSGGMRHYRATDGKLQGVQGAQLLVEHLGDDLERVCWDDKHPLTGAGLDGPESLLTVTFFVFDRKQVPKPLNLNPIVTPVTYRFDRDTRRVLRNDVPLKFGRFEKVRFKFQPANKNDTSRLPTRPGQTPANSLLYWISSASDEKLKTLEPETAEPSPDTPADRRGITTLIGSFHLPGKVRRDQFPGWQENPTDTALDPAN